MIARASIHDPDPASLWVGSLSVLLKINNSERAAAPRSAAFFVSTKQVLKEHVYG
ncbi:MAG: hypothetical protein O9270_04475 [Aquidulcibacter sp.]|uniref:hypothetical protein n=1 Tax=Aquidulcibacter sp. TaxID=2052990 RepID=UPI0022CB7C5D|nr:hypothetical protein [Aquidulcibacter sp.]MCZ8207430.1 hypothetical protein [Aquidulcibacter sp.]